MPSSAMQAHLTLTNLMACSNKMLQVRYSSIPRWPNTSLHISARVLHLGLFMPCWFVSPNLAGTVQLVKLHTEDMWAQKFWIWIAVLVCFFFLDSQHLYVKAGSVLSANGRHPSHPFRSKYCACKDVLIPRYKSSLYVWQKYHFC